MPGRWGVSASWRLCLPPAGAALVVGRRRSEVRFVEHKVLFEILWHGELGSLSTPLASC
jgi:hypothetical protein